MYMTNLLKISLNNENDYKCILKDIIKYSTLFVITYVFLSLTNSELPLFNPDFFQFLFFFNISIIIYWKVIEN